MKNKNSSKHLQYNHFKTQTQEVKVIAAKPDNLRLIPETKGGGSNFCSDLHAHTENKPIKMRNECQSGPLQDPRHPDGISGVLYSPAGGGQMK